MGKQLQKWSGATKEQYSGQFNPTTTASNAQNQNVPRGSISQESNSSSPSTIGGSQQNLNRAALYIFGERSQIKGVRTEGLSNCEFIPVEIHEVKSVKASFNKLMKACCPSAIINDPNQSFYHQFENCEWLLQLKTVMQYSSAIVDLMDGHGASVCVSVIGL